MAPAAATAGKPWRHQHRHRHQYQQLGLILLLLDGLLVAAPLAHLAAAPHTKVEESFALQAAHDALVYGAAPARATLRAAFDHVAFPGAVPRSFAGPLALAVAARPAAALLGFARAQAAVRAALAAANAAALVAFGRAVAEAWGPAPAAWWAALTLAQFHVVFYASRTLPNMVAFGPGEPSTLSPFLSFSVSLSVSLPPRLHSAPPFLLSPVSVSLPPPSPSSV